MIMHDYATKNHRRLFIVHEFKQKKMCLECKQKNVSLQFVVR